MTNFEGRRTVVIANTSEAFPVMEVDAGTTAGDEMITHTNTLGQRAFFYNGDHKTVITPYPLPGALMQLNQEILRWKDIENWSPSVAGMYLSEDILNDPKLYVKLVELLRRQPHDLTAYAITPEYAALADLLMAMNLDLRLREKIAGVDLIYKLDSKAGFREIASGLAAREVSFVIPQGFICNEAEEVWRRVNWFLYQKKECVIKANKGGAGWGLVIINHERIKKSNDLLLWLKQEFERDKIWANGPYVVEEMIDIDGSIAGGSPSPEVYIDDDGPRITYFSEQLVNQAGEFLGVGVGRRVLPGWLKTKVTAAAMIIGEEYARLGYRGFFDVDMVLSKNGIPYVVETNIRRTGGTHVYDLGRAIWGEDQDRWGYLLSEDTLRYGDRVKSAEEIIEKSKPWLYPINGRGEGIVICMIDPVNPQIGYVSVAEDKSRAVGLQRNFRQIW